MKRILVAEDEPTIAEGLEDDLAEEGYSVHVVDDGLVAESLAATGKYDLILLDIMLPGKDGFSVCRSLRTSGVRTPIIMITARGQESDKIRGLDLGADDYVTKPFSPRELQARIRAVLRRHEDGAVAADVVEIGDIRIDFKKFEAIRDGAPIALTGTEFKLLRTFVEHRGEVVTVQRLMERIWGDETHVTERVVYTHINNLRAKIDNDPSKPRLLVSLRGIGYRLDA
jgi:DNA-binding response OmpR family regulator